MSFQNVWVYDVAISANFWRPPRWRIEFPNREILVFKREIFFRNCFLTKNIIQLVFSWAEIRIADCRFYANRSLSCSRQYYRIARSTLHNIIKWSLTQFSIFHISSSQWKRSGRKTAKISPTKWNLLNPFHKMPHPSMFPRYILFSENGWPRQSAATPQEDLTLPW